jgi:HEAT repeat protein
MNLSEGERAVRKLLGLFVLLAFASVSAANVDELIKKLGSKDNEVRRAAAKELGELGKGAKPAIKALTAALSDSDRFVRRWSAEALGKIGPDAKDALPGLTKLLNDGNQPVRDAAIKAIGKMGEDAVPALTRALKGTTTDVQEAAITALGQAGPSALTALSGAIQDVKMDASLRRKAVAAVLALGSEARKAVPALAAAVKNPKVMGRDGQDFRIDSIKALGQLATKEDSTAVAALESITKDPKLRDNNPLKRAATQALKQVESRK